MKKICFVCLGNICRSPMAVYIMKDKVKRLGLENEFEITSRATSYEEIGNDMYPPAKEKLTKEGIPFTKHSAKYLEKEEYDYYDYFFCVTDSIIKNVLEIIGEDKDNKVRKILSRDIADPWYTGDFDETYNDLVEGIDNFLTEIL